MYWMGAGRRLGTMRVPMSRRDLLPKAAILDPYGPIANGLEPSRVLRCLHCFEQCIAAELVYVVPYIEDEEEAAWSEGLWSCPNLDCTGIGYGVDLHELDGAIWSDLWRPGSDGCD